MKITYRLLGLYLDITNNYVLCTENGHLGLYKGPSVRMTLLCNNYIEYLERDIKEFCEKHFKTNVEVIEGPIWDNMADINGWVNDPRTDFPIQKGELVFTFSNKEEYNKPDNYDVESHAAGGDTDL